MLVCRTSMCVVSVVREIDMPISTSPAVTFRLSNVAVSASKSVHATAAALHSLELVAPATLLVSAGHAVQA